MNDSKCKCVSIMGDLSSVVCPIHQKPNQTTTRLRLARETLSPIVGQRSPTTEVELDECVQTLEELRRACALSAGAIKTTPDVVEGFLGVMGASLKEVSDRIKNRQKAAK